MNNKKIKIILPVAIHPIQANIYLAIKNKKIVGGETLRKIAKIIKVDASPQKIKHHLEQLRKLGTIDYEDGNYKFN